MSGLNPSGGSRKQSSQLGMTLGLVGALLLGICGAFWWTDWRGLPEEGVEGARTQGGLRLIARHRQGVIPAPPHPVLQYIYDLFHIRRQRPQPGNSLEIETATAIPIDPILNTPQQCSVIATTPDGKQFTLELQRDFQRLVAAAMAGRAKPAPAPRGGNMRPPLVVLLPKAVPPGVDYLDITVKTPKGTGKWRVRNFEKLPRQIAASAPPVSDLTIHGVHLQAAAWNYPHGYAEQVSVQTSGSYVVSGQSSQTSPLPGVTPIVLMRNPDQVRVAVWLPNKSEAEPLPAPTEDFGEEPPLHPFLFRDPHQDFHFSRVCLEWDYPFSNLDHATTLGQVRTNPADQPGYEWAFMGSLTTPGFGGVQSRVHVDGVLEEVEPQIIPFVFRQVALQKQGSKYRLATPLTQSKNGFTVGLTSNVHPSAVRFIRPGKPPTGPTVSFVINWTCPKGFVGADSNRIGLYTQCFEVLYRDASGRWQRGGGFGLFPKRFPAIQAVLPVADGQIRALAIVLRTRRTLRATPVSFMLPVAVGDPPGVPQALLR